MIGIRNKASSLATGQDDGLGGVLPSDDTNEILTEGFDEPDAA
jgi:hypothetical protein